MIEFLLMIGGLLAVTWVIGQVVAAIIKAPKTIVYHASGQAEKDRQSAAEAAAKRAERNAEFEKLEKERARQLQAEFASEVRTLEASLQERGITENALVVIRRGDSINVDVAIFKELRSTAHYERASNLWGSRNNADQPRQGNLSKHMGYVVDGPVVQVNVAKNESHLRNDVNLFFDISHYSIAKADFEFESIYDYRVYKPLRDKAKAEEAERLKLDNAKSKLDSMFK